MALANYRKFLVALAGLAADAVALGLVSGTAEKWTIVVLNGLTAIGIVSLRNGPKPTG